jgi:thioredoxin reductase (NADPH)
MTEAEHLAKYGSEVTIVHRRDELRASKMLADRVLADPKVRVEWNSTLVDVLGDDFVTGVRLKDTVSGEERIQECKGVFMAIGHTPNTAFLHESVSLKPSGYLVVEAGSTRTEVPGVFGAGDVMDDTYRQAVTAAGTGCMAALEAEKWLAENG